SPVTESIKERLLDLEAMRLEAMDEAGVDIAVLSVATPGVQAEPDAGMAVKRARIENDFLARAITKHPARFAGLAHLPMQDAVAAANELSRCVEQLGFKGAMVNGHTNGRYLDDAGYEPFWERVEALDVPIYLHPRDPFDSPQMFSGRRELSGAIWAWTAETSTHALRLVFSGVFDRHPKAKVILGRLGEALPYMLWNLDSRARARAAEEPIERAPSQILRDNFFVTTAGAFSSSALLCALAELGEGRVMFSADYPYEDYDVAARFLDAAPISEATRAAVSHGVAERLLRL
ncbi:MAG: amidohydrolase, partial [Hyphomicrobiales bacterium]|nr:amidohydrolase [Hyphomicrobiales bacterium]